MRLSTRLMLAMVGLVVLTAAAVGALIHRNIEQRALPRVLDRLDTRAHLLTLQLEAAVAGARSDVSVQGQAIEGLVRASNAGGVDPVTGLPTDVLKKRIASRFVAELNAKSEYSRFRIIGVADGGRELVRVDRLGPGGTIRTVPESELRRVGDRDYFKAAIRLPAKRLYASPIDFDREGGATGKPQVPTLRVAAPIAAASGQPFGLLVVSVDMREAFDRLRNAARQGDVYAVNEQGDYLVHPELGREFGFERGTPFRIQDDFPAFKELLGGDDSTPRVVKDRAGNGFGIGWNTVRLAGGPRITVLEAVPASRLLASNTAAPSVVGALIVAAIALPVVFFLARSLSRPLVQMTRAIEAFGRGITVPAPVGAGGEIGVLARSFTRMAEEVREKTEALKHENDQRRYSERIAEGIIANSLDAIIQVNERGEVIEWNPQAETMLGWSREEAIGRPIADLYLPKGYRPRYLDMNERLRKEDTIIGDRFEFEALRKDGRTIKAEVSMTGVRSRGGNVFNLFLRDITAKLAAEEQLRQSQKMEAVGQLTGGIAHDFNNMLTVITGTIEILADEVADKPQLAAIARLISEAADRGAELTGHLLAFARKQPLQPRDTDVNTLMWNSAKLLKPALGENVEIELKLSRDAWPAMVDANQLITALLNLAVNARDAMGGSGEVMIEIDHVALAEGEIDDLPAGDYVRIAVADTGVGIEPEHLDRVFEPFFTTKPVGKGTGLGLTQIFGFARQSGGHATIASKRGQGTRVSLYLPRHAGEPASAVVRRPDDASAAADITPTHRGAVVLVVEDDPRVSRSTTAALEELGYRPIACPGGREALETLAANPDIDLVVTDVMMPEMTGTELAAAVRREHPGVPILFVTGYVGEAGEADDLVGGELLRKPFTVAALAHAVETVLGRLSESRLASTGEAAE